MYLLALCFSHEISLIITQHVACWSFHWDIKYKTGNLTADKPFFDHKGIPLTLASSQFACDCYLSIFAHTSTEPNYSTVLELFWIVQLFCTAAISKKLSSKNICWNGLEILISTGVIFRSFVGFRLYTFVQSW